MKDRHRGGTMGECIRRKEEKSSWNLAGSVTPSLSQIRTTSFRSILSFPLPLLLSLPVP